MDVMVVVVDAPWFCNDITRSGSLWLQGLFVEETKRGEKVYLPTRLGMTLLSLADGRKSWKLRWETALAPGWQ